MASVDERLTLTPSTSSTGHTKRPCTRLKRLSLNREDSWEVSVARALGRAKADEVAEGSEEAEE